MKINVVIAIQINICLLVFFHTSVYCGYVFISIVDTLKKIMKIWNFSFSFGKLFSSISYLHGSNNWFGRWSYYFFVSKDITCKFIFLYKYLYFVWMQLSFIYLFLKRKLTYFFLSHIWIKTILFLHEENINNPSTLQL